MMTEEEAKTKWCPFARVKTWTAENGGGVPDNAASANRTHQGRQITGSSCIASACMAWRWGNEADGETPAYRTTRVKDSPGHFDNAPLGYCGLAGKVSP